MTFLAPIALALGLAVAVPLTLHLLNRHHAPRIPFPAVRYLRRAEREHATRLRLRQVALLALRVLAILLLAAAAARPFLPATGRDHPPTSVVMVLDNSLASGAVVADRRVLDALKDAALETLGRAGPEDRIWLIRAGQPWEPAFQGEPRVVAEVVQSTAPSAGSADLSAAIERAASILAAEPAGRPAEIHVLSNLGAASLGAGASTGVPVLVLAPRVHAGRNLGVTAVEVGGGLPPRAGETSVVTARVDAFGSATDESDSVAVRLVVDGTVRAVVQSAVGEVATLPLPATAGGLIAGRVEIDADALAQDDRRHFVVAVRAPPVTHLSRPTPFLDEALAVLDGAGRVRRGSAAAADVVIAPGGAGAEALRRGAAVVVLPPATPLELAATNQRLAAAGIPQRYAPPEPGEARFDPAGSGLEGVLEAVRLRQVYGVRGPGSAQDTVLLRLDTGEAWAVAGGVGATGRYVILATPFTVEGGTLPTSAAMIPLLDRAINAWALGGGTGVDHEPGTVVALPDGNSILRPDGGAATSSSGSLFRLTDAGIYRVLEGDSVVAAFAVNPTRAASDTRPVDVASAARTLGGEAGRPVSDRAWGDTVFRTRMGTEAGPWLVVLALLALLAEAGVAASGRGRRPTPVGHPTGAPPGTATEGAA
jgi:hypothetical protein